MNGSRPNIFWRRSIFICLLVISFSQSINAQFSVEYSGLGNLEKLNLSSTYRSAQEMWDAIEDYRRNRFEEGFLSFSIDSVNSDQYPCQVYFFKGSKYVIGDNYSQADLKQWYRLIEEKENEGYPFASVSISSELEDSTLIREMDFDSGPYVQYDSLVMLKEGLRIPESILAVHLGVKQGEPYSEKKIKSVDGRLRELPFLQVVRSSSVIFADQEARVLVGVDLRNANKVDGIVGFQPDENGEVVFTGEFSLGLHNSLNHLDKIDLLWQRVADNSQKLDLGLRIPYLFETSIGVDGRITQFRQDSTFNEVSLKAGLFTALDNGGRLEGFIDSRTVNNLLNLPEAEEIGTSILRFGLSYEFKDFDDLYNPLSGRSGLVTFSYGDKDLEPSDAESEISTLSQWTLRINARQFIRVGKKSTLLVACRAFHMESDKVIFNELDRIGGLLTLRGMDEQSIRASTYAIGTGEFRVLTGERSFVSTFIDYAAYRADWVLGYENDNPFGVGIGGAFETGAGMLSLNYALGSQFGQALSFSSGKVHFGYSALF